MAAKPHNPFETLDATETLVDKDNDTPPVRPAKAKAMQDARWKGAAPTGSAPRPEDRAQGSRGNSASLCRKRANTDNSTGSVTQVRPPPSKKTKDKKEQTKSSKTSVLKQASEPKSKNSLTAHAASKHDVPRAPRIDVNADDIDPPVSRKLRPSTRPPNSASRTSPEHQEDPTVNKLSQDAESSGSEAGSSFEPDEDEEEEESNDSDEETQVRPQELKLERPRLIKKQKPVDDHKSDESDIKSTSPLRWPSDEEPESQHKLERLREYPMPDRLEVGSKSNNESGSDSAGTTKVEKKYKSTAAYKKAVIERPVIKRGTNKMRVTSEKTSIVSDDSDWPVVTHLGTTESKLTLLNREPRFVVQRAMALMKEHILMKNAFPAHAEERPKLCANLLLAAARERNQPEIGQRIQSDEVYTAQLASLVSARVGKNREAALIKARPKVVSGYEIKGNNSASIALDLVSDNFKYIFPFKPEDSNGYDNTKPYQHPVILETLREAYFGTNDMLKLYPDSFKSTRPEKPDVKQMNPGLLALTATAVYHAILEHAGGNGNSIVFDESRSDVYQYHLGWLKQEYSQSSTYFHGLMKSILNQVTSMQSSKAPSSTRSTMTVSRVEYNSD